MAQNFYINDSSNPQAKAFLEFIKTLDFVSVENDDQVLSQEQMDILNERRADRIQNDAELHVWEDVQEYAKKKHKK